MYAYNLYWNANKSMLLFPSSRPIEEGFGNFWKSREIDELNQYKIGFADILDENLQLNFDVGNQILSKLF
jgi:5-methylcytosine-specific restriction enzyme subunit McrC